MVASGVIYFIIKKWNEKPQSSKEEKADHPIGQSERKYIIEENGEVKEPEAEKDEEAPAE